MVTLSVLLLREMYLRNRAFEKVTVPDLLPQSQSTMAGVH